MIAKIKKLISNKKIWLILSLGLTFDFSIDFNFSFDLEIHVSIIVYIGYQVCKQLRLLVKKQN